MSLTQLSSCLEASTEVLISPEGLNQRFNQAAFQFLQHLLTELLEVPPHAHQLKNFIRPQNEKNKLNGHK
ncbi:hypothetical protein ICG_05457 [Bacillus cereus BAG1X1-3]|nr:hypothetical protein ICG_05457 [Bacillus cereus BAG1X1-3]EOO75281.1 hypothetical protein IC7_05358 [Bacillus cereus BAG1O-1]